MSVNKVILMGGLGRDPEMRYMPNGEAVANLSIATTETWKDKSGAKQEKTEWHNLVAYRRLAEVIGEYCKKGSQIYVEGKLQTRSWEKDGVKRYSTEIIVDTMQMIGGNKEGQAGKESAPKRESVQSGGGFDDFDNDIPFANPYKGRNSYVV